MSLRARAVRIVALIATRALKRRVAIRRAAATVVAALMAFIALTWAAPRLLPPELFVDPSRFSRPGDSMLVTDRNGEPLRYARVDGIDRRWVTLDAVSPHLIAATISVEDQRFLQHDGVDAKAIARASVGNVIPWRKRSGASTITQQLIKLVYGRPAGAVSKWLELVRAAALERLLAKDEILEQYLNRLPFGDRIEGVARASEAYFGCPVSDLTVSQAALIAGIPQAPSVTEPRRHLVRAIARRDVVLGRMLDEGAIDEALYRSAVAEQIVIRTESPRAQHAPRFVEASLRAWRAGRAEASKRTLETTLDLPLQTRAEGILRASVDRFASRGVSNAAAIVVSNESGEVLAYVGAARGGAEHSGGYLDLLVRPRQPGSSLKPFAYELLFERGGTAATLLDDMQVPRTGADGTQFDPRDYDGRERGPVRARVALASSLNLAALDAAARVGQHALVSRLRALGIGGADDPDRVGAAAVLGGVDASPWQITGAYVALARGGTSVPLRFTSATRVAGTRVMKPEAAALVTDILSDRRVRAEAFGKDLSDLAGTSSFALKTGTSSGWRDAWAAVYTRSLTVVVWLGDPSGLPLGGVSGFEAAAPAAASILRAAIARNLAAEPKDRAPVLVPLEICSQSGLRAGERCRHVVREVFAPGTEPEHACDRHDDNGAWILDARHAEWARRVHPAGVAAVARSDDGLSLKVRDPADGSRIVIDPSGRAPQVPLRASSQVDPSEIRWEVDGRPLTGSSWSASAGDHSLVALWKGQRSPASRVRIELP